VHNWSKLAKSTRATSTIVTGAMVSSWANMAPQSFPLVRGASMRLLPRLSLGPRPWVHAPLAYFTSQQEIIGFCNIGEPKSERLSSAKTRSADETRLLAGCAILRSAGVGRLEGRKVLIISGRQFLSATASSWLERESAATKLTALRIDLAADTE
jgi:hypothetical protein